VQHGHQPHGGAHEVVVAQLLGCDAGWRVARGAPRSRGRWGWLGKWRPCQLGCLVRGCGRWVVRSCECHGSSRCVLLLGLCRRSSNDALPRAAAGCCGSACARAS
jgi:hypothetical protein